MFYKSPRLRSLSLGLGYNSNGIIARRFGSPLNGHAVYIMESLDDTQVLELGLNG